jgi:S1-C subfamily serine protease
MQRKLAICGVFLIGILACSGQKIKPSTEAKPQSLKQRYKDIVCAIALISTERGSGTGFFVDPNGDLVTAAHVVSTKAFKMANGQLDFDVNVDSQIKIRPQGQRQFSDITQTSVDVQKFESERDLVYIHTGLKPPCFLPLGDSSAVETGDSLLTIGFPGIDNGNPILYEGFLSGRFPHPPISVGTLNGQPIFPTYEILKVQMPITPGSSGSPIVNDDNQVVGVISESPVLWTQELEQVTHVAGRGSGITISGFDAVKLIGQLAVVVHEFESPGSGYAVPISDLKPERRAALLGSTRGH